MKSIIFTLITLLFTCNVYAIATNPQSQELQELEQNLTTLKKELTKTENSLKIAYDAIESFNNDLESILRKHKTTLVKIKAQNKEAFLKFDELVERTSNLEQRKKYINHYIFIINQEKWQLLKTNPVEYDDLRKAYFYKPTITIK